MQTPLRSNGNARKGGLRISNRRVRAADLHAPAAEPRDGAPSFPEGARTSQRPQDVSPNAPAPPLADPKTHLERLFWRTTRCHFFAQGNCKKGNACSYAHDTQDLRSRPDLTKTTLCRGWLQKKCELPSSKCRFAHGFAELRDQPPQADASEATAGPRPKQSYGGQRAYGAGDATTTTPKGDSKKEDLADGPPARPTAPMPQQVGKAVHEDPLEAGQNQVVVNALVQHAYKSSNCLLEALLKMAAPDHYED